jgi:hypothetical protein
LIAPLAALAPRGSRFIAAYFVVARPTKSVRSLLLSTAPRDPDFGCFTRCTRDSRRSQLA